MCGVVWVLDKINSNQNCLQEHTGFSTSPGEFTRSSVPLEKRLFIYSFLQTCPGDKHDESAPEVLGKTRTL